MTSTPEAQVASPPRARDGLRWILLVLLAVRLISVVARLSQSPTLLVGASRRLLSVCAVGVLVGILFMASQVIRRGGAVLSDRRLALFDLTLTVVGGLAAGATLTPGVFNTIAGSPLTALAVPVVAFWALGLGGRFAAWVALLAAPLDVLAFTVNRVPLGAIAWRGVASDSFWFCISVAIAYAVHHTQVFSALSLAAIRRQEMLETEGAAAIHQVIDLTSHMASAENPRAVVGLAEQMLARFRAAMQRISESAAFKDVPKRWRLPRHADRDERVDDRLTVAGLVFRAVAPWVGLGLATDHAQTSSAPVLVAVVSILNCALVDIAVRRGGRKLLSKLGFAVDLVTAGTFALLAALAIPSGTLAGHYADIAGPFLWASVLAWVIRYGPRTLLILMPWWLGIQLATFALNGTSLTAEMAFISRTFYFGIAVAVAVALHRVISQRYENAQAEYAGKIKGALLGDILDEASRILGRFGHWMDSTHDAATWNDLRRRAYFDHARLQRWMQVAEGGDSLVWRMRQLAAILEVRTGKSVVVTIYGDPDLLSYPSELAPLRLIREALQSAVQEADRRVILSVDAADHGITISIHAEGGKEWVLSLLERFDAEITFLRRAGGEVSTTEVPGGLALRAPPKGVRAESVEPLAS